MQILDKAITPDGIEIELRDLSGEHKLPDYNGMILSFVQLLKILFLKVKVGMHRKVKNFGHLFIVVVTIQKTW